VLGAHGRLEGLETGVGGQKAQWGLVTGCKRLKRGVGGRNARWGVETGVRRLIQAVKHTGGRQS
jgi:hypothetical protein